MKFIEISGSILCPVSNEENILLEKVRGHGKPLPRSRLDERERELARALVHRGILTRLRIDDKLCFVMNAPEEAWGF